MLNMTILNYHRKSA